MANWSVSPSTNVSIEQSTGKITFPENTGTTDIIYTISYTSDTNCTASTTYTIPACPACEYEVSVSAAECDDSTGNSRLTFNTVKNSCSISYWSYTVTQGSKTLSSNVGATVGQDMTVSIGSGWTNGNATVTWAANTDSSKSGSTTVKISTCTAKTKITIDLYTAYLGLCNSSSETLPQGYNRYHYGIWAYASENVTSNITISFTNNSAFGNSITIRNGYDTYVESEICILAKESYCPCNLYGVSVSPSNDGNHTYELVTHFGEHPTGSPDYCS